jgi:transposase
MPAKRLSMRKLRDVLRLRFEHGLSDRAIGRCCSISHRTAAEYLQRFHRSGLCWPLPEDLDEQSLHGRLFPDHGKSADTPEPQMPDLKYLHREREPNGYGRSQFYDRYRKWAGKLNPTMRLEHKAGEKVFVDWAGKKPEIVNPETGEILEVDLFVGCLGASSYTYAEATLTQSLPEWIGAHIRMLEFFGARPKIIVSDNLRSGVSRACRYEPDLNPTYQDYADHYDLAIIPARVAKARDKAKVESAVGIAERMILGGLRHQSFFSLAELNAAIAGVLERLNNKKFQKLDTSRRELFEQLDLPAMRPLPAKVNIDYHIEADRNYYSVHYGLIHQSVELRLTASTVEVWHQGRRVASHPRMYTQGRHYTQEAHRPPSHTEYLRWTPERILAWGRKSGPWTESLMEKVMTNRKYPEQGYRSCLGILRLAQKYGAPRLENACQRAVRIQGYSYKSVKSILDRSLDEQPLPEVKPDQQPLAILHDNIRGKDYYQ